LDLRKNFRKKRREAAKLKRRGKLRDRGSRRQTLRLGKTEGFRREIRKKGQDKKGEPSIKWMEEGELASTKASTKTCVKGGFRWLGEREGSASSYVGGS